MPEYYQAVREVVGGLVPARRFARLLAWCNSSLLGLFNRWLHSARRTTYSGLSRRLWSKEQAPDFVTRLALRLPDGLIRRRPMFAYRQHRAKYVGGDPNSAASFVGA